MMQEYIEEKVPTLWHAYSALDTDDTGKVPKGKLMVRY